MLSWRLHTRPEKAELQELNTRLHDYVCRVRELERENLLLAEELRSRRGPERLEAEVQARWAEQARGLRQQLHALGWATALAAGESAALRRELRALQLLGPEARAARGRLDAELGAQRRELQEALGARAALEALLARLQAERRGLDAAHEREVRALRARAAAGWTLRSRARPAAAPPPLREAQDRHARLLAESWRDTVQQYEDGVRGLEEALRRGQESRRRAEEEARLCAQEAEALQLQALEMEQVRAALEDQLLRLRQACELQAQERQDVITCLEDEKAALTLAMADRLRDYQELVQVKTGLSLEVATYRALLEGESNPEILIRVQSLPQGFGSPSYQYTGSGLQREDARNLFARQKATAGSFSRRSNLWAPRVSPTATGRPASRGTLCSGLPSVISPWQENASENRANGTSDGRAFSPTPGLFRKTETQLETFPRPPRSEGTRDPLGRANAGAGASASAGSDERAVAWGTKTEAKAARGQERSSTGTEPARREERMFDSKEKASEERNLRWEELTKLDKEARQRESRLVVAKARGQEPSQEKRVAERGGLIRLEVSQDGPPEGTPKGSQMPMKEDVGGGPGRGGDRREAKLRWDTGDAMTETIAENIVSGILKQLGPSPDTEASADSLPDTKVTYVGRKELPGDRRTKTEILVESNLTEEVDVSDEAGLHSLLSKDVRDEVGRNGKSTEQMIGDLINLGLKGRQGAAKVVNVEIVEEPVSCVGGEKVDEFSTPFRVDEVEDVSPSPVGLAEQDTEVLFSVHRRQTTGVTHVEEVTEAGDSEGEPSYFVSTPDECPERDLGSGRDEGSMCGQIHVEEEATVRYSWRDEIAPGAWRGIGGPEALGEVVLKPLDVLDASLEGGVRSPPWKEQAGGGESQAEAAAVGKEGKMPQGVHSPTMGDLQEPRAQLAEVVGQLEEKLPARLKEELRALAREGQGGPDSMSVDLKQVQTSADGAVTLVAEVNLSETVDADQWDLEELSRDEDSAIEKAVEAVVRAGVARRRSPDRQGPVAGLGFKRWATQELYSPSAGDDDPARATSQGPVSATVEVTSPRGFARSHVLEDVSQSVRHVEIGPPGTWRTEHVPPGGEGGPSQAASSVEASWSGRHFPLGSDPRPMSGEIFEGPAPACWEAGDPARLPTAGAPPLNTEREAMFQSTGFGAGKAGGYVPPAEGVGTQTFVKHFQLGPRVGLSGQIQFTAPLPDSAESGVEGASVYTGERAGEGPHVGEVPSPEQVGPRPAEPSGSERRAHGEGLTEVTQATRSYTVGRKVLVTDTGTFQGAFSEPSPEDASGVEVTLGTHRSWRPIRPGPGETRTSEEHVVFRGPVSKTFVLAGSADTPERGEPAPLGPRETSFTFQMDVGNVEATTPSWTREDTGLVPSGMSDSGAWRDPGSSSGRAAGVSAEGGTEQAELDKTLQLQRMVDQRSVVSAEKKVAVLYLDNQDEEEEGEGGWF